MNRMRSQGGIAKSVVILTASIFIIMVIINVYIKKMFDTTIEKQEMSFQKSIQEKETIRNFQRRRESQKEDQEMKFNEDSILKKRIGKAGEKDQEAAQESAKEIIYESSIQRDILIQ